MKIPRDRNGADLARRLATYGYVVTRQSGSHMRLSRQAGDQHVHEFAVTGRALRSDLHTEAGGDGRNDRLLLDDRDSDGQGRIGTGL